MPKTQFEKLGYYEVFKKQDVEGDGALDKDEMREAMIKLVGDQSKVNTTDQVKKAIVDNLHKEIAEGY